jgi:hypothetical protein
MRPKHHETTRSYESRGPPWSLLSQRNRWGCRQRHPHRRRPQPPTCPRLAENYFVPDPRRPMARARCQSTAQIGFLTADSLYEHGKLPAPRTERSSAPQLGEPAKGRYARDDSTPIPRPSTFHGQEKYLATREEPPYNLHSVPKAPALAASSPQADVPIAPAAEDLLPGRIEKSVLTISEPKRRRDKAHLRYVATQPCLGCGRQPSDPHHLKFTQLRALGLKVSDELTVPLCRGHHRQLHQAGNEVAWWDDLDIDALAGC